MFAIALRDPGSPAQIRVAAIGNAALRISNNKRRKPGKKAEPPLKPAFSPFTLF
jgi:hypothetical protein